MSRPEQVFTAASERVKMIDMHPAEPLFICAQYNSEIKLWNYETQILVKSFDTGSNVPVRCARFIPALHSFACGADDTYIRVYNYNTMERTRIFQAHDDYIRCIAVHEQLPVVLTSSDDMTIRQWDWSKDWALQMTYDGHAHYCMAVVFNPHNPATFASASLDALIKVWNLNNPVANFQLEGHEDGVNCLEYYSQGNKPYLLSGSDDHTVRLWDYQTKACLQVFNFHSENVTAVLFHPDKPLIFTIAEDDSMRVISAETFRLLNNMSHTDMGRGWTMAARPSTNLLLVGYDKGFTVFKVGDDRPVYSMDGSGRVYLAMGNEIRRLELREVQASTPDGEVLHLPSKDLGTVESTPISIAHAPGGQFMAVMDKELYTIISTLSMRPKSYGRCISFVWGPDKNMYAVLETSTMLKLFRGGGSGGEKECRTLYLNDTADRLFTGALLGVQCRNEIIFFDWSTLRMVRSIDGRPSAVHWNGSGTLLALAMESALFVLRYHKEEVADWLEKVAKQSPEAAAGGSRSYNGSGGACQEEEVAEGSGLEFAFELQEEVDESARELLFLNDAVVFINQAHRLSYTLGGEVHNIAVLSRDQYLLGYYAKENRIMCINKERHITSYTLKANLIEYMSAVLRDDAEAAAELLDGMDDKQCDHAARFLQSRGLYEQALATARADNQRFDLAVQLKKVELAQSIAAKSPTPARWKQLGRIALEQGYLDLAIEALTKSHDYSLLMLVYAALNDRAAMARLGRTCMNGSRGASSVGNAVVGRANVAFACCHLAGQYSDCAALLSRTGKVSEAALYARTYCPEEMDGLVEQWRQSLSSVPRIRDALATPREHPELFPTLLEARERRAQQQQQQKQQQARQKHEVQHETDRDSSEMSRASAAAAPVAESRSNGAEETMIPATSGTPRLVSVNQSETDEETMSPEEHTEVMRKRCDDDNASDMEGNANKLDYASGHNGERATPAMDGGHVASPGTNSGDGAD